jgi:hypothetical protein
MTSNRPKGGAVNATSTLLSRRSACSGSPAACCSASLNLRLSTCSSISFIASLGDFPSVFASSYHLDLTLEETPGSLQLYQQRNCGTWSLSSDFSPPLLLATCASDDPLGLLYLLASVQASLSSSHDVFKRSTGYTSRTAPIHLFL